MSHSLLREAIIHVCGAVQRSVVFVYSTVLILFGVASYCMLNIPLDAKYSCITNLDREKLSPADGERVEDGCVDPEWCIYGADLRALTEPDRQSRTRDLCLGMAGHGAGWLVDCSRPLEARVVAATQPFEDTDIYCFYHGDTVCHTNSGSDGEAMLEMEGEPSHVRLAPLPGQSGAAQLLVTGYGQSQDRAPIWVVLAQGSAYPVLFTFLGLVLFLASSAIALVASIKVVRRMMMGLLARRRREPLVATPQEAPVTRAGHGEEPVKSTPAEGVADKAETAANETKGASTNGPILTGDTSRIGFWPTVFHRPRTFVLLCLFVLVLLSVMLAFVRFVLITGPISVNLESGSVRVRTLTEDKALFALVSSLGWANTGIHVEKGAKITFGVSGAYNTATHHLVQGATHDFLPDTSWAFWPGSPSETRQGLADRRSKAMMMKGQPQGTVLGHICCSGSVCPDVRNRSSIELLRQKQENDPGVLFVAVGPPEQTPQEPVVARCDGTLYLSVNENYPLERDDYVGDRDLYAREAARIGLTMAVPGRFWTEILEWGLEAATYVERCPELVKAGVIGGQRKCAQSPELFQQCAARLRRSPPSCTEQQSILACILRAIGGFEELVGGFRNGSGWFAAAVGCEDSRSVLNSVSLEDLLCVRDSMRWEMGVKQYPWLWYDDNMGFYLVSVAID